MYSGRQNELLTYTVSCIVNPSCLCYDGIHLCDKQDEDKVVMYLSETERWMRDRTEEAGLLQ